MKDFTLDIYRELLETLQKQGYELISYGDYCRKTTKDHRPTTNDQFVILRHDVDLKAPNSLKTAQIEHSLGAKASYYFRIIPESNQPEIIRSIAQLGHEIGYHYEDMSLCGGDIDRAYDHSILCGRDHLYARCADKSIRQQRPLEEIRLQNLGYPRRAVFRHRF